MLIPRDYQDGAHGATIDYLMNPATFGKNPLVVMATGLGKSLNIAMLIWHLKAIASHLRIMQLCHVKELVESNYEELEKFCGGAIDQGMFAAGLGRRETDNDVTFAMINSVAKRAASFKHVDFVIIDECHRLSPNDASLYGQFLAALREINPNLIVIGYTATDYRMKGGKLTEMGLFDDVVFDIGSGESFIWAVENGYLILPVPSKPDFEFDDTGIGLSGGDFKNNEASEALHEQDIINQGVDFTIATAQTEGRKRMLGFAQSIEDAEMIADMLSYKGFPSMAVHSKRNDRDKVLEMHKNGELWGVINKDILTTGYNDPWLDLMACWRLTRSPGLWVQMVGRMTRPAWFNHAYGLPDGPSVDAQGRYNIGSKEGRLACIAAGHKQTARVLDFTGNTTRLGPINYPNVPSRKKKSGGDPPVRTCDGTTNEGRAKGMKCVPATLHHTSVKVCPMCGYEWPKETSIKTSASKSELISKTNPLGLPEIKKVPKEYEVLYVHEITAVEHQGRDGKPNTFKATYRCGTNAHPSWLCFNHPKDSWAFKKAQQWWKEHKGFIPAPNSVQEAIDRVHELRKPEYVKVWINTRYPSPEKISYVAGELDEDEGVKFVEEESGDPMGDWQSSRPTTEEWLDDEIPF